LTVGTEKGDVFSFQWVIVGEFVGPGLWFGFSGEGRVIDFHAGGLDDSDISWDSVSALDENDISDNEFFGVND
jgi:hypothetical protein